MSEKGDSRNRRTVVVVLGTIGAAIVLMVVAIKALPGMLSPKVVSTRRPAAELALPPPIPARQALVIPQGMPQAGDNGAMAVAQPTAPQTVASAKPVIDEAVDGEEYVAELGRVAGLTEDERAKMQPFLELIARSQELVARTSDPEVRADMTRRLQYQAAYGMKLRVAPEKRDRVAEALQKGVPRLVFPNAKKPNVITQKVPASPG
jgi:hypothetical protein